MLFDLELIWVNSDMFVRKPSLKTDRKRIGFGMKRIVQQKNRVSAAEFVNLSPLEFLALLYGLKPVSEASYINGDNS